jgi:hypothetical protein
MSGRVMLKSPWVTQTVYDIQKNWQRRKDLLPLHIRKSGVVPTANLNIQNLPDTSVSINSLKRGSKRWETRVDMPPSDCAPVDPVTHHIDLPSHLQMRKSRVEVRRPSRQLDTKFNKSE